MLSLGSLALDLQLRIRSLGSVASDLWFLSLGSLVQDLWLRTFGLGSSAQELWRRIFSLGYLFQICSLESLLRIFNVGSLAQELRIFSLGSLVQDLQNSQCQRYVRRTLSAAFRFALHGKAQLHVASFSPAQLNLALLSLALRVEEVVRAVEGLSQKHLGIT